MEYSAKNTILKEHGTDVHASCVQRYAELQASYEHKNIEMIGYKTKANYWEAQFRQLKTREEELVSEVEELKAKLRKREKNYLVQAQKKIKNPKIIILNQKMTLLKEIVGNSLEAKVTDVVIILIYPP